MTIETINPKEYKILEPQRPQKQFTPKMTSSHNPKDHKKP